MKLKSTVKIRLSAVVKMNWRCSRTRMPIKPRKASRSPSKFKLLELKSMPETKKSETFQLKFTQSSRPTRPLKEKMKASRSASTSSRRSDKDNKEPFTNRMELYQNGNRNASLKAHAFPCLKLSATPSSTELQP